MGLDPLGQATEAARRRALADAAAIVVERLERFIAVNTEEGKPQDARARFLLTTFGLGYQEGWSDFAGTPQAALMERAAIVAWLRREDPCRDMCVQRSLAAEIEAGEHLKETPP